MMKQPRPPIARLSIARVCVLLAILGVPFAIALAVGARWWVNRPFETDLMLERINEVIPDPSGPDLTLNEAQFDLTNLLVPRSEIEHGAPKDGIPALTYPAFVSAIDASHVPPDSRVLAIEMDGDARAYPISMLNYHEVVNDTVGDTPITIIYCPLCDSASIIERTISGTPREFGVSGQLLHSNVLLYDRTDHALWSQVEFRAISGPHAGTVLKSVNAWTIQSLAAWRAAHPDGRLLGPDQGIEIDYLRNPYEGYLGHESLRFPVPRLDERLARKTPVIGVWVDGTAKAYPIPAMASLEQSILRDDRAPGGVVEFTFDDSGGVTITHAPDGARVIHTLWFAWASAHPRTSIYEPG